MALTKETKWEKYELTTKDINDVVESYVQHFFITARHYPELNQLILYGVSKKTGGLEARQDVLENRIAYLNSSNEKSIRLFYEYVFGEFTKTPKSYLYGKISLNDGYIEPMIDVKGKVQSVSEYLEKWVESESFITVIGGEPGQGKTSLCWKAMCDFYKSDWLTTKVDNVFCFSLNQANTGIQSDDSFTLYKLLSWGNNRTNNEHVLNENDCKNALIFFDGFDELKEWHPTLSLKQFIEEEIIPFQEETGSHIVITSRNMAIESDIDCYELLNGEQVLINKLQPIKRWQQIRWIESYIEKCGKTSSDKALKLAEYKERYKKIPINDELEKLFGIPLIFRMLVEAHYFPEENQSVLSIFDNLFSITWTRHGKKKGVDAEKNAKKKLQRLALKIYIDDNDTTEIGSDSKSPWLFSFYTTYDGKKKVGFLHRSFYQYFLAHEILSWYYDHAKEKNDGRFRKQLSYLARRKLDKTTLKFIREIYEGSDEKECFKEAFEGSYKVLKDTDGFLPLPVDKNDAKKIGSEKQIIRTTNVFGNIISIGSICSQRVSLDNINIEALRTYELSECILVNAMLHDNNEVLKTKDSLKPYIYMTNLSGANLRRVDLSGADLRSVDISRADLGGADLIEIDLSEACTIGTDFGGASLISARLRNVDLSRANLSGVNLSGADLSGAYLSGADLSGVDLSGADLRGAVLRSADLSGSNLSAANFSGADLSEADLGGVDLSRADLGDADLSGTDLRNADLSGTDFSNANLIGIKLVGAITGDLKLEGAKIEKHVADHLKRVGCNISNAIIMF